MKPPGQRHRMHAQPVGHLTDNYAGGMGCDEFRTDRGNRISLAESIRAAAAGEDLEQSATPSSRGLRP